MTILSDYGIAQAIRRKQLVIDPLPWAEDSEPDVQPASVDLRLGAKFAYWSRTGVDTCVPMDPMNPRTIPPMLEADWSAEPQSAFMVLEPGDFALGHTIEVVKLGTSLCAQVDGKSSLGRVGLFVHATAGFIDPGWEGQITLELFNAAPRPIRLTPGMPVCQLVVHTLSSTVERPYGDASLGSRYQGSRGPVQSLSVHSRRMPLAVDGTWVGQDPLGS